jgi:hypothetical protein
VKGEVVEFQDRAIPDGLAEKYACEQARYDKEREFFHRVGFSGFGTPKL